MELSPKILHSTSELVKEVGNMAKKGGKIVSPNTAYVERAAENIHVPAETWAAYSLRTSRGVLTQLFTEHTPANIESLTKMLNLKSSSELKTLFLSIKGGKNIETNFFSSLKLNNIKNKDISSYIEEKCFGGSLQEALEQGLFTKEEFFKGLVEDMQAHSQIKSHPIFAPYNLSLKETSEISELLKKNYIQTSEITSILKRKNAQLFETLGGDKEFDEIKGINKAYNSLKELQKNIHGEYSIKPVIENSNDIKRLGVNINGEEKPFLYTGSFGKGSLRVPAIKYAETKTLIESNMVTKDLIDNPELMSEIQTNKDIKKLLSSLKLKYETPTGDLIKTNVNFMDLMNKVQQNGINSLNSNEIHALTDGLTTVFDYLHANNPTLEGNIIKSVEKKGTAIYSAVQDMKDALVKSSKGKINSKNGLLNINGYEFKDHFFMRMMDRNLANVTDNTTGKILGLDEVVAKIVSGADTLKNETAGNFDFAISGVQGHGLKVLGEYKGNTRIIDSIMQ